MRPDELEAETVDSIRAHHASGHFDHEEARYRLTAATGMTRARADLVLAQPVAAALFDRFKTWPGDHASGCPTCAEVAP